ncbi:ABC transporter substrate-binding protein [Coralliovum pocilloporae]|uniref:ABC transporter substrate-binding protein n=1 Tax=Coralliovum pocilloporae TaxID=3066369 RepID=UPI003306EE41
MSTYRFGADLAVTATMPSLNIRGRAPIKVGVLAPFTGIQSSWGLPGIHASLLWADYVNAAGGLRVGNENHPVEIASFDDQYDPARALIGARKLVHEDEVKLMVMLGGDTVPAISDFLTREKVLATTLLPSDLSPDIPYLIAPCEVHPIYVVTGVDWIAENRPDCRKVAICAQKDALGLPSVATYRAAFEAAGMDVTREILFPGDLNDVDAMVAVMLEDEPDILCWDTTYEPFVHALTEAAFRAGFKGQLLSCTCDNYHSLIAKTSTEFMEGFIFQFPDFDDEALNDPRIRFDRPNDFYKEFNLRYPGEWSAVPWEYFSILEIWRKAVELAQTTDPFAVLTGMKTEGFSFNAFGDARWWGKELFGIDNALVGSWPVVRITDGKARIVEYRSILDWWEKHGDLLLQHMRAYGQMWDQQIENRLHGQPVE